MLYLLMVCVVLFDQLELIHCCFTNCCYQFEAFFVFCWLRKGSEIRRFTKITAKLIVFSCEVLAYFCNFSFFLVLVLLMLLLLLLAALIWDTMRKMLYLLMDYVVLFNQFEWIHCFFANACYQFEAFFVFCWLW